MADRVPRLLIVAGSDSGGGAGLQADLRTCAAHRVFGTTAITAITAQNTVGVHAINVLSPSLVRAQIDAVLDDIGADAIKIGMLANAAIVQAVAAALRARSNEPASANIVLDPVMIAKSGDALLAPDAVAAVRDELLPLARVVTPNIPELAALVTAETGKEPTDAASVAERIRQAMELAERGAALAVVAKGGHGLEGELVDVLVTALGEVARWTHPRQQTRATHGTGCTLSTAIACRLARGRALAEAVGGAIAYLQSALAAAQPVGRGHGPVNHLWEWG